MRLALRNKTIAKNTQVAVKVKARPPLLVADAERTAENIVYRRRCLKQLPQTRRALYPVQNRRLLVRRPHQPAKVAKAGALVRKPPQRSGGLQVQALVRVTPPNELPNHAARQERVRLRQYALVFVSQLKVVAAVRVSQRPHKRLVVFATRFPRLRRHVAVRQVLAAVRFKRVRHHLYQRRRQKAMALRRAG